MQKSRTSILLALACVAGIACEVHLGDPNPQQPAASPAAAVAPPAPPPTANPGQPASAAAAAPVGPAKVIPLHLHSGVPAPNGGAAAATTAPSCLDSGVVVSTGDCNSMQSPDSTCAPSSTAKQKCNSYRAHFTPKVAAAAVACMTALSSRQVCDAAQADGCATSALAQACPDGAVAQLCSIAATTCKTNASDCASMLSGLNDQARQRLAQCVAQGCAAGLYACVQGLVND